MVVRKKAWARLKGVRVYRIYASAFTGIVLGAPTTRITLSCSPMNKGMQRFRYNPVRLQDLMGAYMYNYMCSYIQINSIRAFIQGLTYGCCYDFCCDCYYAAATAATSTAAYGCCYYCGYYYSDDSTALCTSFGSSST